MPGQAAVSEKLLQGRGCLLYPWPMTRSQAAQTVAKGLTHSTATSTAHTQHPGRLRGLSEMKLSGQRPRTGLKTMFPLWVIKSM